eukprot:TRINITY_DN13591_c0_g1_i4.p1 TRINITY_DN13591_c0_g1~~TRINITY_DN13591_c0_g1_i4.p1  ORF type:complete len:450 (+),score=128.76 TRINITY_DN13591_c0_g1_i4:95-1444(+)
MTRTGRVPAEFFERLPITQARDCVLAVYAEAQRLHSKIVELKQSLKQVVDESATGSMREMEREVSENASEMGELMDLRDWQAEQMDKYLNQIKHTHRLHRSEPELSALQADLDSIRAEIGRMEYELAETETELGLVEFAVRHEEQQEQISMVHQPKTTVTIGTQTDAQDTVHETREALEALERESTRTQEKMLAAQASIFEAEISKLKRRLAAANTKIDNLLNRTQEDQLEKHYKTRLKKAEKDLARSKLRLVGRAMVLMAKTLANKDTAVPTANTKMNAFQNLLAVENNSPDAPQRKLDRGSTGRGSAVSLGVACNQRDPEFFCRMLRGNPTAADFERTISNVLGQPMAWLEEFESMGGLELIVNGCNPPVDSHKVEEWKTLAAAVRTLYVVVNHSRVLFDVIAHSKDAVHKLSLCAHKLGDKRALFSGAEYAPVSYTHLTLPTKRIV